MTCKLDAFKTAIEKLKPEIFARKEQNKLRELELASKDVLDAFFGQGDLSLDLQEQVIGEVQIEKQLRVLNHLVRYSVQACFIVKGYVLYLEFQIQYWISKISKIFLL